jgi:hypothetical protein
MQGQHILTKIAPIWNNGLKQAGVISSPALWGRLKSLKDICYQLYILNAPIALLSD